LPAPPRERRDPKRRAEVFARVVQNVVNNPHARFTVQAFQSVLGVPEAAARHILQTLVSVGILAEVDRGVWARTWAGVLRA
jgi:Fic family protein